MAGDDAHALLREEPYIRYDRNTYGGRIADRYLRAHEIQPTVRFELTSLSAILFILLIGLVWMTRPVRSKTPVDAGGAH
jgi:DNA-binding transcriptional LysR family regulator